jgi:hypothetical protein
MAQFYIEFKTNKGVCGLGAEKALGRVKFTQEKRKRFSSFYFFTYLFQSPSKRKKLVDSCLPPEIMLRKKRMRILI